MHNSLEVQIVVIYGCKILREQKQMQASLELLMSGVAVILGDWTGVSVPRLDFTSEGMLFGP